MHVLGIDFGTSNTVAVLRSADGRVRPLLFDGAPILPSAVYYNSDGRMLVGRDAERNARMDPARFEPNPKRRIDDGSLFLGTSEIPVPQVFAYVLQQVALEAQRQAGQMPGQVRLTHPARWGERRRAILVDSARLAGLPAPQLIPEPVAAASYFTSVLGTAVPPGRSLAIYDLGGGTFDATVVRRTQTGFEVLAEEGVGDIGGLDFDHGIVEHLGKTYGASHAADWQRLLSPADDRDRRYRRMLYEDVRGAKETLSRTASADIHLPALEVDAHLTRAEFEDIARPPLERTVDCLQRAISAARMNPADLVGIFLVGGSSRIPMISQLIHSKLGVPPQTFEQPETVVVEGAVRAASGPAPTDQQPLTRPTSGGPVSPAGHSVPRPPMQAPSMQAPQAPPQMLPPQTNYQPAPQPQPVYQQQPAKRPLTQEPAVLVTGAAVIILFVIFFVILSTII
ncbi:Hsp70 family protein [Glycomyces artemisiae]|uniref:Hsp70 protein n=2 Tax=Glycomyces artemisiae TaxID=1076443 RepID=A0A2T0UEM3_9ACTN|nr:Hsp70 family protein [Glycomyces artemisiae]PRY56390.1 Hsp70 protein [Glycomyces artemisiae]